MHITLKISSLYIIADKSATIRIKQNDHFEVCHI